MMTRMLRKLLKKRSAKAGKQMAEVTGADLLAGAPPALAPDSPPCVDLGEREQALMLPAEMMAAIPDPLAALRSDFDRLVERMQTPAHKAAVDALFAASGAELGAAAVHAREGASLQTETRQKITAKKRLIGRMVKSTARASVAIDDAVAYVEKSNKRIADLETKKSASKGKNEKKEKIAARKKHLIGQMEKNTTRTMPTGKRVGIAESLREVPGSIDAHNEEVTRLIAEDSDRVMAYLDQTLAPTPALRAAAARLADRGLDKNERFFRKLAVAISKAQAALRQQYRAALERVAELDPELEARLVHVLGTKDNAAKWFFTGHMLVNGRSPLELIASGMRDVVLNELGQIESGACA